MQVYGHLAAGLQARAATAFADLMAEAAGQQNVKDRPKRMRIGALGYSKKPLYHGVNGMWAGRDSNPGHSD